MFSGLGAADPAEGLFIVDPSGQGRMVILGHWRLLQSGSCRITGEPAAATAAAAFQSLTLIDLQIERMRSVQVGVLVRA